MRTDSARRSFLLAFLLALVSFPAAAQTAQTASPSPAAAPATASRAPKAWIANTGSDSVAVVDTATNAVVSTIPVGDSPMQIAIRPDQARAYVTNFYSGSVSVIDTTAKAVVATIPVGQYPSGIAVAPNGARAYVVRDYSGLVSVLDLATNTVLTTIPIGVSVIAGTGAATFSPDGARAYVVSGKLWVIDTATNAVIGSVASGAHPVSEALTADGAFTHVVNEFDGSVVKIATASQSIVASVPVGDLPFSIALTPNQSRAYVTIAAHLTTSGEVTYPAPDVRVKVIDLATSQVAATIVMSSAVSQVAVLPGGARAYVTLRTANAIGVIDTATNAQIATVPSGGLAPSGLAFCAR